MIRMATLLLSACATGVAAQTEYVTVALSGDPAPGAPTGVVFDGFVTPVINASGTIAFRATLSGTGVSSANDAGIWAGQPGLLQGVAREGDAAADTFNSEVYADLLTPTGFNLVLNDAGEVGFLGVLDGPSVSVFDEDAVWVGAPGSLQILARGSDFAPGTPDLSFFSISVNPRLNNSGRAGFASSLIGDGVTSANNSGLWSGAVGSVALVAREGDAGVGGAPGQLYGNPTVLSMSDSGAIVFRGSFTGPGVTPSTSAAIWSGLPGSLALAARAGNAAPGTPAGVVFDSFGFLFPAINADDEIAFYGELAGPGVTALNDRGVWAGKPGLITLRSRAGDPVVGGLVGEILTNFTAPVVNAASEVAFSAATFVSPIGRTGIFAGGPGSVVPVALEGEPAPGTGADFGDLFPENVALTGAGRISMQVGLAGAGVNASNDEAIFAQNADGALVLVARAGDAFDVDPSAAVDNRTIAALSVQLDSGGGDGRSRGMNDANQLVFRAAFTDGTEAIILATLSGTPCLADVNGDGSATPADLNAWIIAFNNNAPGCDQNGDGLCNPADFNAWIINFNAGC